MSKNFSKCLSNETEFKQEMMAFFRASQVPMYKVEQIMKENRTEISKYLMATPELMARKFYYWTFGEQL